LDKGKKQNGKVKLKRGDQVIVTAGKSKGSTGKILHVDRQNMKVIVESANMITKHMKANRQQQSGGIIKKEAPIHISNVMYLHKGEPTKIGYKLEEGDGGAVTKVRVAKKTGDVID